MVEKYAVDQNLMRFLVTRTIAQESYHIFITSHRNEAGLNIEINSSIKN